jgi:hypothetical protein
MDYIIKNNYFLPFVFMFVSTFFGLYEAFYSKIKDVDFFPNTLDKSAGKKLIYYLSHLTNSSSFILTFYLFIRLIDIQYDELFILISPISLSVNLNYFLILHPSRDITLYEMSYKSIVNHFMTTFIVFYEINNIEYDYSYLFMIYMLYAFIMNIFNYYYRSVWTYGICNLYELKGWILFVLFTTTSFIFNLILYYYNYYIKSNYIL